MTRKGHVIAEHERFIEQQLRRHDVQLQRAKARFVSPHEVELMAVNGSRQRITAELIVIATGSRPRTPPNVAVDHEANFDSDSILSLAYVPRSLAVYGAGVIASEYASIFANIGVEVVMIDKSDQPVSFLDRELTERFLKRFEAAGGRFVARSDVASAAWDGVESVVTTLKSGEVIRTDKALCALGRLANVHTLELQVAGVAVTERGLVAVDANCRTAQPHIYAVGDVIGPPSLAATSMEQGRRAMHHALGIPLGPGSDLIPVGVYTIPEMASVGMSEAQAITAFGSVLIGRADFGEVARGHIAACEDGFLKLLAEPQTRRVVGVHVIGEGAAELVHVGQMAIIGNMTADTLISTTFNFPTLAEAYRIAALDLVSLKQQVDAAA
jgi:NAD(P) transhydrogenase